jgi:NTE family protein
MTVERPRDSHVADLVLEGGGVKGIGLVGAVCALARQGYRFDRIAGTSAGAIVGALVAACQARGSSLDRIEQMVRTIDYPKLRDLSVLPRLGMPGKVMQLVLNEGLYEGDYLSTWLTEQLGSLGVVTFDDLRVPGVMDDAPMRERYRLVVVAADISRQQVISLPWDFPRYGLDPDRQPVAHAVRASASIPFFFEPVIMHGTGTSGDSTLVDGGLLWNFPLDIFAPDGSPGTKVIGVKLSAKVVVEPPANPSNGVWGLAWDCLSTLLGSHERYHISNSGADGRIIFVNAGSISSLDFDIDSAAQDQLFVAGNDAALRWLGARVSAQSTSQPAEPLR